MRSRYTIVSVRDIFHHFIVIPPITIMFKYLRFNDNI